MNGEIQQASNIVISARKALREYSTIDFALEKYVLSIQFSFATRFFCKSIKTNSVSEWFNICIKRNLQDIKIFLPIRAANKDLLGFVNTSQVAIICYWKNGRASCFYPMWEFDPNNNGWKITYTEKFVKNDPLKDIQFTSQTNKFKQTLLDIEKLATEIDEPHFAEIFHSAYQALEKSIKIEYDNIPSKLSNELKAIYYAVDKAYVFGGMGSWNDSPAYLAQTNNLYKEYNELSYKLLMQLHYNLMYVVNEC